MILQSQSYTLVDPYCELFHLIIICPEFVLKKRPFKFEFSI